MFHIENENIQSTYNHVRLKLVSDQWLNTYPFGELQTTSVVSNIVTKLRFSETERQTQSQQEQKINKQQRFYLK